MAATDGDDRERYAAGFAVPREPPLPDPAVRRLAAAAAVLLIAGVATVGVRLAGIGEDLDPALSRLVPGATEPPATPTAPASPAPTPAGTPDLPAPG